MDPHHKSLVLLVGLEGADRDQTRIRYRYPKCINIQMGLALYNNNKYFNLLGKYPFD
jgi:hypothetical protein